MAELKGFSEGKREYRPAPFWSWNDALNEEELLSQMQKMKAAGYGGFFMHSRVGLITPYLSEEWMKLIRKCAENSEKMGLDAWLYDEDMWPSGYASGVVPAMSDEFKEQALVFVPEEEVAATDKIVRRTEWGGKQYCVAHRTCAAGMVRFNGQCYIDTLNPAAVRAFLDSTHEKYRKKLGDMFGKEVKGIFTDEPCYGIHWFYTVPHVTYSRYLRERILREKGYDILERCEQLFLPKGDYKKTRYDYYTCAGDQFAESFTKQYDAWCRAYGLCFTGHLMAEETMYEQAQWTGGVMYNYLWMEMPGVDKLMRGTRQLITIKQLTSVEEQAGKARALSECFAGLGHESGFAGRKKIMDWQAVNGISFVNMHLSHYSLRGERKRDYPPDIFYQQPYFEDEKFFSDYAARLSQLAAYGQRDVHVLIVQPLYSVFANYAPDAENARQLAEYDKLFVELSEELAKEGVDFHYGDERVMKELARADGKVLRMGAYEYDTVILCHCESVMKSTQEILKKFGGRILVLGQSPRYCEYDADADVRVDERYANAEEVARVLRSRRVAETGGALACRRTAPEGDVYLFANSTDKECSVQLPSDGFVLDISRGAAYPISGGKVRLCAGGSLCLFTGGAQKLSEWNIPVRELPELCCDGAIFYTYEEKEVAVPAPHVRDENALPLDRADFEAGGVSLHDVPLESVWHYYFYKLPEGTRYTMRYRFFVRDVPEGPLCLVAENAENVSLYLNGEAVKPLRYRGEKQVCSEKTYKDVSFTRCAVSSLRQGENEILLEGEKHNNITDVCSHRSVTEKEFYPTEAEAVYIVGDFSLKKGERGYEICESHSPFGDVANDGYPFYSGALEYTVRVSLDGKQSLLLDCDCAYADLQVNGVKQVAGANPYVFDLRGISGDVTVKIRLFDTLFALLGPHHIRGYDELPWVDAGIFNDLSRYEKESLIKPFGLKQIKIIQRSKINEK